MRRLLTLISIVLAPMWASASDMPRVVSVNVCTDQLIMLLADPAQVVSLSQLSDDPRASVMAEEAKRFAKNNGRAEVIAVQNPDIVVAGEYNDPALIALLRSIGIEVVQFPVTRSLDDIPQEIRKMGAVLGRHSKAETLATALERDLENRPVVTDTAPLAAFFLPNGYALGAGTLSHDILVAGGARNLSVELGFQGNGTLSLEQVILHQPDLLIGSQPFDGFSLSEEMVSHPALSQFPVLNTTVEWVCGTPFVMNAVAQVAERVGRLR
ncbi:ABC transporter substrate-binding protein [Marivita sp.]|uniref:ABC transporter substrate-binding protein n=1 Tax=Marivita sp. TaxID=2003365 RepID=UPI003F71FE29